MLILVVEDESEIREEVAEILEDEGYQVQTAAHGAEALERLRGSARPRLILLDLMMPVMDGPEFRAAQLADPLLAEIPVVIATGAGNVHQRANDLKAAGYLAKPFGTRELLKMVSRFCTE